MRITVLGGGSWGTALAHLLADKGAEAGQTRNLQVTLLVRDAQTAEAINEQRENPRYLPGLLLSPHLRAETSPGAALDGAEICLLAVPCQHLRETLSKLAACMPAHCIPVCASKGVEVGTQKRMSEVVADILPSQARKYAILSGPSFAKEVVQGKPTAVVLGCADAALGERLRALFAAGNFRVYSSTDVVGVELGGAIKNIIAIAAGLCDGLGLGHNSRAALITRGIAEMSRFGVALGARPTTFMGLSGLGDLVLTCTGDLSRNRQVGMRLAAGESMSAIRSSMRMVAEGVKTTEAICLLAENAGVDLPIAQAMSRVLSGDALPLALVQELMARALREE